MGVAVLSFFALFILIGSAGVLLYFRAGMVQRLSSAIEGSEGGSKLAKWIRGSGPSSSLKNVVQGFEKILPKSPKEVSVIQKRLIRAGYRDDGHVRIFYGAKVLLPFILCLLLVATGLSAKFGFFGFLLAIGLGFLAPDFWLGRRVAARQTNVQLGLPEVLDLLVVCLEAGLSLDQALNRSIEELRDSQPEISDEFGLVMLEQRAGHPRVDAWRNLAERVDIQVIRALVAAIVQAEQFGTSMSKVLRGHSETLRVQRRQQVEEQAMKTAVKLVFPLVLFIFPSLFVVVLGPAVITISENFKTYFK